MKTVNYDLLSSTPPTMPKNLPGFVRHAISNVPKHMRPAASNMVFPPASSYMTDTVFVYKDNVEHEPASSEGCISASGVGKSYVDTCCDHIAHLHKEHDKKSEKKLEEWARECKSKGANKDKAPRPLDCAIFCPDPDITNPAFIQLLSDAERDGNHSLYLNVSELDMLNYLCGSHRKLSQMIRNMTDKGKTWGAHRATVDGVSGRPPLRVRINYNCVPEKAQYFWRDCTADGTTWRLGCSYIPRPTERTGIPKQGKYDEAWYAKLDEYLERLSSTKGRFEVKPCLKLIHELDEELSDIADLCDNSVFESMYHRSLVIAWIKGCLLWVTEGCRWSNTIAEFVRFSLYYDLWSKIQIFAPHLKQKQTVSVADVKKYGPTNMLDLLDDTFSKQDLENLRISLDKPADATSQLKNWLHRGFITLSNSTGMYSKTPSYLENHKKE